MPSLNHISLLLAFCFPHFCFSSPPGLAAIGAKVKLTDGVPTAAAVSGLPPEHYSVLATATTLKSLSAAGKTLNDSILPLLAPLAGLEEFSSDGLDLTDEGFRHFAQFPKLRSLSLFHPSRGNAAFTGAGLAHLQALPQLQRLTFAGATAGDPALEAVARLSQLREFRAWHNTETAQGNAHLASMTWLTHLKIGQRLPRSKDTPASFDAATIPLLAQMSGLQSLELTEAILTASDLAPLASLPGLRKLTIKNCAFPPADLDALRTLLPQTEIIYTPMTPEETEALLVKKLKLAL